MIQSTSESLNGYDCFTIIYNVIYRLYCPLHQLGGGGVIWSRFARSTSCEIQANRLLLRATNRYNFSVASAPENQRCQPRYQLTTRILAGATEAKPVPFRHHRSRETRKSLKTADFVLLQHEYARLDDCCTAVSGWRSKPTY